jgi:hypothetical protein
MHKRSHGPCVGVLQHFLIETIDAMLDINNEYDDETEKWVKILQEHLNMEVTGDFDWPTRRRVKAIYSFDFDAECGKVMSPQTTFMQPDGMHGLNWPPQIENRPWRRS